MLSFCHCEEYTVEAFTVVSLIVYVVPPPLRGGKWPIKLQHHQPRILTCWPQATLSSQLQTLHYLTVQTFSATLVLQATSVIFEGLHTGT